MTWNNLTLEGTLMVGKGVALLKAWISSVPFLTFLATDWLTGNVGLGVALSAAFSVLTAIVVTRPKMIAARAAALVNTTSAQDAHYAQMIERLSKVHVQEIEFWKSQVGALNKKEILIRATKHKAINAYQGATLVIQELHTMLKERNIAFPAYQVTRIAEITGDEDRKMIAFLFDEEGTK